MHKSIKEMI